MEKRFHISLIDLKEKRSLFITRRWIRIAILSKSMKCWLIFRKDFFLIKFLYQILSWRCFSFELFPSITGSHSISCHLFFWIISVCNFSFLIILKEFCPKPWWNLSNKINVGVILNTIIKSTQKRIQLILSKILFRCRMRQMLMNLWLFHNYIQPIQ